MAANGYDGLCEEIYEQIYEKLERRDEETLRFAPRGTAKKVLHVNNLLRFFRSLVAPGRTAMDQFGLTEEDLAARISSRHLHDFLAILIFATCGIEAARTFATRLVAEGDDAEWPALDGGGNTVRALPASREGLVILFGNVVTADKFFSKQACFCPVVIRKREEFRVQDLEAQRLPYLAETRLGKGSFGEVFKVRIAKGHFYDPQAKAANVEPAEMARKDYLTSLEFSAGEEREIMEQILNSPARTCENILENYGSLEIGTGVTKTYSLFMPLAICDLRAYMMDHHKARPNTIRGRASIILSAQGLAGGLNFLHTQMKTSDMDDLVCYHMDLKPSNILVFRDTRNGETRNIWKLSDFGMARVKIRRRGQDGDRERNFDSWFVRRQRPQDPSLSATLNRRGEGTYLAPESLSSTRSMKAESDVWSLGCIISVVFAYLEEGSKGVERYQDARMVHPHADLYDRFFLRGRFSRTKTHPVVNRWHTHLIDKANQRDPAEGEVVKAMLRYLEDRVFEIDQSKRRGAKDVERMLVETFRAYKALSETGSTPNLGETQSKPLDQSIWSKMLSRNESAQSRRQVEEWYLSASEGYKGCEISPDGALVAYWTDIKISLFTSQSLPSGERNVVTAAAEYVLEITDCIWKSVSLAQRYLIASTTGANFQCYIFDLERGSSVDASLDHWYRVVLPLPEISKLAISPDGQTVACVLRGKEGDDDNPGSLFPAPVLGLIKIAQRPPTSSTVGAGSEGYSETHSDTSASVIHGWPLARLDWKAADVTYLSFPTSDDVYLVVRPELTARSHEHKIPIIHLRLRTKTLGTLIIESRGLDSSSTAGLFTAFAPFRQDPTTCAVVTREKSLHIQKLTPDDTRIAISDPVDIHRDIPNYRVRKVLMAWRDDRMFAVGRTSANHKMLLLELAVPREQTGPHVVIRELAQLPGLSTDDEFVVGLSDEEGEQYILVAVLAGVNRRAIYRIRLPEELEEGIAAY